VLPNQKRPRLDTIGNLNQTTPRTLCFLQFYATLRAITYFRRYRPTNRELVLCERLRPEKW